jgi:hypothetical protein
MAKVIRNTFIIFLVSGFWHGANWTFIAWGGIHALLFIPVLLSNNNKKYTSEVVAANTLLPSLKETLQMTATFALAAFAWIFFRAPDVSMAFDYIQHIGHGLLQMPTKRLGIAYVIVPLVIDWQQRWDERKVLAYRSTAARWIMYVLLGSAVLIYSVYNQGTFIYFQF